MDPQQHRVIRPQPGNLRDPRKFVGREAVTSRARQRLTVGANLLLTDFRRMGKTFWMHAFAQRESAFIPYLIDYEGKDTTEEFLTTTANALASNPDLSTRARRHLATMFKHVDSVGVPGLVTLKAYHANTPPLELLTSTLQILDQDDNERISLVLMDEVPMAVSLIAENEGPQAAKGLLQTLRGLRQATTRVRWIVTGSIGFHHALRQAGTTSGDISDLEPLHLGPMPEAESRELAQGLLRGIHQIPYDSVVEELVNISGGIPAIMHQVLDIIGLEGDGVTKPQDVRDAFETMIDNPDTFRQLKHFVERVHIYYGPHTALAEQVLNITSEAQPNTWVPTTDLPSGQDLETVIELLCSDHYLERHGSRVRWIYPAFAYIWARKHNLVDRP